MVTAERDTVALLKALRATWAALVQTMVAAVELNVPDYGAVNAIDLRGTVDRIAGIFAKGLAGEPPTHLDLQWLRSLGARRARAGLNIETIEAAVQAAMVAALGHVSDHLLALDLEGRAQADLYQTVLGSMLQTQHLVLRALNDGFSEARAELLSDDAAFVDRVVTSSPADASVVASQASAFGIGDATYCGIVLLLVDGDDHGALKACGRRITEAVDGAIEGPIRWERTPHMIVLIRLEDAVDWATRLQAIEGEISRQGGTLMVASRSGAVLPRIPDVYMALQRDLEYARIVPPRPPHLNPSLLQLCRLLGTAPAVERFALFRSTLGQVVADPRNADLLDLLDTALASGSRAAAAEHLGRHKETVSRGLATVKARTGLDWHDNLDFLLLSSAIVCRWLAAASADYDEAVWGPRPKHLDRVAR